MREASFGSYSCWPLLLQPLSCRKDMPTQQLLSVWSYTTQLFSARTDPCERRDTHVCPRSCIRARSFREPFRVSRKTQHAARRAQQRSSSMLICIYCKHTRCLCEQNEIHVCSHQTQQPSPCDGQPRLSRRRNLLRAKRYVCVCVCSRSKLWFL